MKSSDTGSTVASQMARLGFPQHAVALVDAEMADDEKKKLLAAQHGSEIREILEDWTVRRQADNLPYIHL